MAVRTTSALVQGILLDDYGKRADGTSPSLTPFIATASAQVDQVATDAALRGVSISTTVLELMERWLAAHYYTKPDPVLSNKSQGGKSGTFVRGQKEPEPYKDVAIGLDPSGILAALLNRQTAGLIWLGKPVSDQIPYDQRS